MQGQAKRIGARGGVCARMGHTSQTPGCCPSSHPCYTPASLPYKSLSYASLAPPSASSPSSPP